MAPEPNTPESDKTVSFLARIAFQYAEGAITTSEYAWCVAVWMQRINIEVVNAEREAVTAYAEREATTAYYNESPSAGWGQ